MIGVGEPRLHCTPGFPTLLCCFSYNSANLLSTTSEVRQTFSSFPFHSENEYFPKLAIFLRKNNGFLPSLAFTNSLFFSAAIPVFSLPWPLRLPHFSQQEKRFSPFPGLYKQLTSAPIFAENRSKSEIIKEF